MLYDNDFHVSQWNPNLKISLVYIYIINTYLSRYFFVSNSLHIQSIEQVSSFV